jgi:hypothetical protein
MMEAMASFVCSVLGCELGCRLSPELKFLRASLSVMEPTLGPRERCQMVADVDEVLVASGSGGGERRDSAIFDL